MIPGRFKTKGEENQNLIELKVSPAWSQVRIYIYLFIKKIIIRFKNKPV